MVACCIVDDSFDVMEADKQPSIIHDYENINEMLSKMKILLEIKMLLKVKIILKMKTLLKIKCY